MPENLKKFIESELYTAKHFAETPSDVYNCRAIAYGAFMFAAHSNLIDDCDLWDDYWTEFQKIMDNLE